MQTDCVALSRRILRPNRPRLAEARAVVAELADPRHAWEALAAAGIIEPAWISHPARRFCGIDGRASPSKWPTSVPMCLALAADAPGVEAVESLARDFVRALEVWGCPPLTRIAWSYGGDPGQSTYRCLAHAVAHRAAAATSTGAEYSNWWGEAERIRKQVWAGYTGESTAWLEAGWDAVGAFWWGLAARRRGTVPPELLPRQSRFADKALAGRLLRALRNPFEPMLAIWEFGYGCGELTAHDIVLVVPEIE